MHHLGREFEILKSGCFPGSPAVKNRFEIFAVSRDFNFQAIRPQISIEIPEADALQLLRCAKNRSTECLTVSYERPFLIIQQGPPIFLILFFRPDRTGEPQGLLRPGDKKAIAAPPGFHNFSIYKTGGFFRGS